MTTSDRSSLSAALLSAIRPVFVDDFPIFGEDVESMGLDSCIVFRDTLTPLIERAIAPLGYDLEWAQWCAEQATTILKGLVAYDEVVTPLDEPGERPIRLAKDATETADYLAAELQRACDGVQHDVRFPRSAGGYFAVTDRRLHDRG